MNGMRRRAALILRGLSVACASWTAWLCSGQVHAQSTASILPRDPVNFSMEASVTVGVLDPTQSSENQMEGWGVGMVASSRLSFYEWVTVSGSLSFLKPEDRAQFEELVVPSFGGDVTTAESTLYVFNNTLAIGPRSPTLCLGSGVENCAALSAFADLGYTWVHGSRRIDDCSGCPKQELEFENGAFFGGGLEVGKRPVGDTPGVVAIPLYRYYLPGVGLRHEFRLGVAIVF